MSHFENEITIDDVVDSFSVRLEKGERPSIEEYKDKYPHLADRIEAVLPALVVLENVDSDPSERRLAIDDSIPEMLGEYQIIQEIGRGGMGIVFEAQHATMRRRVALKVLPKSSAEKPNYLKRFLTEAQSAGQLHHTNIVPVFEVGESDGLHYYSMQYIHGDNLAHVIDDIRKLRKESNENGTLVSKGQRRRTEYRHSQTSQGIAMGMVHGISNSSPSINGAVNEPTATTVERRVRLSPAPVREEKASAIESSMTQPASSASTKSRSQYHQRVAAAGVQVAKALAYAHSNGVLHRDVKPANLILDTEGNVWITDFGLAKLDANDLTQTGDIIGTLRYMAPERFAGEADGRSDIYSLGLTLYELCTLKCAFESDRGTLVQDVSSSSSVTQPRKIDESIPSDLETIILKAIEPQPERRYQTADEFAEDLELFLADRPIMARRATWAEKLWRICRRNPVVSSLAACVAVLLFVTTVGSIQFARSEIQNRKESQKTLFYSKIDQAKMRRFSGRPGQRFEAIAAIKDAVNLLPHMEFQSEKLQETKFVLRSEVIAASSVTDIKEHWSLDPDAGWGNRNRVAFDYEGNYFAEGHDDGRIRVRRLADKSGVVELPGGRGSDPPWVMIFSPNGKYLAARYHQPNVHNEFLTVVWDVENNASQEVFVTRQTLGYSYSKDSQYLAILYRDKVEVVRLKDGCIVSTIYPQCALREGGFRVALNADASVVAISERGTGVIEFWKVLSSPILDQIVECKNTVYSIAWDSEQEVFAVGGGRGTLDYWVGDLLGQPKTINLHQNTIHTIHVHSKSELVATSAWDGTTRFTDLVAGKEVLITQDQELLSSGFSQDGRLGMLTDGSVAIWDVALPMTQYYSTPENQYGFTCCIHPVYSNLVCRTLGEQVDVWDIDRHEQLLVLNECNARKMFFSKDGKYLFCSGDNGLQMWSANYDGNRFELFDHKVLISQRTGQIALSHYGSNLIVGVNDRIKLINYLTGEVEREFGSHRNLNGLQFTADDRFVLTGTWHGEGIKVWEASSGEYVQVVDPGVTSLVPVAHPTDPTRFFSSSRLQESEFTLERSGKVDVGEGNEEVPQFRLKRKFDRKGLIRMSDDGSIMMVKDGSFGVLLVDTETQRELASVVSLGRSRIIDWMMSSDGKKLVLACFDSMQVFDLEHFQTESKRLGLE